MPQGKPAGVRCVQLDAGNACLIFGHPDRPAVCSRLQPSAEMCGSDAGAAMHYLARLELLTQPWRRRQGPSRSAVRIQNG